VLVGTQTSLLSSAPSHDLTLTHLVRGIRDLGLARDVVIQFGLKLRQLDARFKENPVRQSLRALLQQGLEQNFIIDELALQPRGQLRQPSDDVPCFLCITFCRHLIIILGAHHGCGAATATANVHADIGAAQ